jgi:hypothetical protein
LLSWVKAARLKAMASRTTITFFIGSPLGCGHSSARPIFVSGRVL